MSRSNILHKTIIALGALSIPLSFYVNKLKQTHASLSSQIAHFQETGQNEMLAKYGGDIVSFSNDMGNDPSEIVVIYDEAVKVIKASDLPDWSDHQILTAYMQHNMIKFAELPQGWLLWMIADKERKRTFHRDYLSTLSFTEGDRVCDGYTVQHRDPSKIEMSLSMGKPGTKNYVEGRLVISIEIDKDKDTATCRTRTYMWRRKDGAYMPLERVVPKFLHELASWGLMDQGIRHLKQLKGKPAS